MNTKTLICAALLMVLAVTESLAGEVSETERGLYRALFNRALARVRS